MRCKFAGDQLKKLLFKASKGEFRMYSLMMMGALILTAVIIAVMTTPIINQLEGHSFHSFINKLVLELCRISYILVVR